METTVAEEGFFNVYRHVCGGAQRLSDRHPSRQIADRRAIAARAVNGYQRLYLIRVRMKEKTHARSA